MCETFWTRFNVQPDTYATVCRMSFYFHHLLFFRLPSTLTGDFRFIAVCAF